MLERRELSLVQCVHLGPAGDRCPHAAQDDSPFCHWHDPENRAEPISLGARLRRLGIRLAALVLLVIFLTPLVVQGYQLIKALLN